MALERLQALFKAMYGSKFYSASDIQEEARQFLARIKDSPFERDWDAVAVELYCIAEGSWIPFPMGVCGEPHATYLEGLILDVVQSYLD